MGVWVKILFVGLHASEKRPYLGVLNDPRTLRIRTHTRKRNGNEAKDGDGPLLTIIIDNTSRRKFHFIDGSILTIVSFPFSVVLFVCTKAIN